MATRKTTFEVVKLAEIAPLLKDAEVLGEAAGLETARQPAKILSVSHDQSLAATREMLFTSAGFQVSSALSVDQAIQLCADRKFELIVIGHSIPIESRRLLIEELRARCTTPLLALQRPGEDRVTDVDYAFDSTQSPGQLLKTVVNILRPPGRTGYGTSDN
jgi:DNA-binding NtrC family response regulator